MELGYRLKLKWASHRLDELFQKSIDWITADKYPVIDEPHTDGAYKRRVRVIVKVQIPADPFSLLIGEILYSLRSALDNLVFDLRGGQSQRRPDRSEFPILSTHSNSGNKIKESEIRKRFDESTDGVDPAIKAIVESLQPYHKGNGMSDDPLWRLNTLCNIDKHRALHVVACHYAGAAFVPAAMKNVFDLRPLWTHPGGALDADTVVVKYTPTPVRTNEEVRVEFRPVIKIGFAEGPLVGQPVADVLSEIGNYITTRVITPIEALH